MLIHIYWRYYSGGRCMDMVRIEDEKDLESLPLTKWGIRWMSLWWRKWAILLEKFQRGTLCPHRDMQQSSLCVQMFYFNMKRHSVIHGIMYTWYEHDKGATDTEAIVSDWKTQLAQRRSPVFTMLRGIVHGKTKVRLHYLLLPLPRPPRGH